MTIPSNLYRGQRAIIDSNAGAHGRRKAYGPDVLPLGGGRLCLHECRKHRAGVLAELAVLERGLAETERINKNPAKILLFDLLSDRLPYESANKPSDIRPNRYARLPYHILR